MHACNPIDEPLANKDTHSYFPVFHSVTTHSASHLLHDDAAAARLAPFLAIHLESLLRRLRCPARGIRRHLFIVSADLTDDIVEGLVDVFPRLCGGLDELAAKLS